MDFFAPIFSFVTDNSKKYSSRAITIIITIIVILLLDNVLSFSYYYNLDKKIKLVTELTTVIKDTSLKKNDKLLLSNLRLNVITHKSIKDRIWDFLENPNISWGSNDIKKASKNDLNYYIFIITATSIPIALMIYVISLVVKIFLTKKKKQEDITIVLIKLTGIGSLLYVIGIIEVKLLLLIPIILNSIYYNFVVNILINIAFVILLYMILDYIPNLIEQRKLSSETSR